jgi:hypothetical protein
MRGVRVDSEREGKEQLAYLDGGMMELTLLLPEEQALALEQAARQRGLTGAQLTRRLIGLFLEAWPQNPS